MKIGKLVVDLKENLDSDQNRNPNSSSKSECDQIQMMVFESRFKSESQIQLLRPKSLSLPHLPLLCDVII